MRRPEFTPHEGPCGFDSILLIEPTETADGGHGQTAICRCGKWKYFEHYKISAEVAPTAIPQPKQPKKLQSDWLRKLGIKYPIFWSALMLILAVAFVNNEVVRDIAIYPVRLMMLAASFLLARFIYKSLDKQWEQRKQTPGNSIRMDRTAFIAAVLVFFAVGIFLEALPTHQVARSFAHEAYDDN